MGTLLPSQGGSTPLCRLLTDLKAVSPGASQASTTSELAAPLKNIMNIPLPHLVLLLTAMLCTEPPMTLRNQRTSCYVCVYMCVGVGGGEGGKGILVATHSTPLQSVHPQPCGTFVLSGEVTEALLPPKAPSSERRTRCVSLL